MIIFQQLNILSRSEKKQNVFNDVQCKIIIQGLQSRGLIPTMPEDSRNVDIEKTFGSIMRSRSALVSISDSLYPILSKMGVGESYICDQLYTLRIGGRSVIMSMFVAKASPLRDIFNVKILVMLERGVNHRILSGYFIQTSVRCLRERSSDTALGPKDFFTAYIILVLGFGAAVCSLGLEQLLGKGQRACCGTKRFANERLKFTESEIFGKNGQMLRKMEMTIELY